MSDCSSPANSSLDDSRNITGEADALVPPPVTQQRSPNTRHVERVALGTTEPAQQHHEVGATLVPAIPQVSTRRRREFDQDFELLDDVEVTGNVPLSL